MIAQFKESYPSWKNIILNQGNMRTRIFKWKLIDFESLIPTILEKYPKLYLNNITIACSILEVGSTTIAEDSLFQNIKWNC